MRASKRDQPTLTLIEPLQSLKSNLKRTQVLVLVSHTLCCIIFLSAQLVQPNNATSNVNFVWLAKDHQQHQKHRQQASKYQTGQLKELSSQSSLSDRSGDWLPSGSQLLASSSWLQPSIRELDRETYHSHGLTESPKNGSRSEGYTTLEPIWSNSNNQSNSQVQFDEDHLNSMLSPSDKRFSPVNASSLYFPSNTSSHLLQRNLRKHSTQPYFRHPLNETDDNSTYVYYMNDGDKWNPTDSDQVSDPPGANSGSSSQANSSRRKLHNSGTQYDLKEKERVESIPKSSLFHNKPSIFDTSEGSTDNMNDNDNLNNEANSLINNEAVRQTDEATTGHQEIPIIELPEPLVSTEEYTNQHEQINDKQTFEFNPTSAPNNPTQSEAFMTNRVTSNSVLAKVTPSPSFAHFTVPPSHQIYPNKAWLPEQLALNNHRAIVSPKIVGHPVRHSTANLWRPVDQALTDSRRLDWTQAGFDRASLGPPLADGYNRILSQISIRPTGSPKPKRSLLGTLGSKLNNWIDGSRGIQNLETYFYDTQPDSKPKPAVWPSTTNYYPATILPGQTYRSSISNSQQPSPPGPILRVQPMMSSQSAIRSSILADSPLPVFPGQVTYYTPMGIHHRHPSAGRYLTSIRQPTVAPASSSLDRFYGISAPPGFLYPSKHRHRFSADVVSPTKTPVHDRLQQPASFIPVVAVSVTRTSPAPKANAEENSAEIQSEVSEIDEYIDKKTGNHRTKSNSATQFNDEYLASGSINRDSSDRQQLNERKNQVRHSMAPSQEQTTTIKSALFGYLPHELAGNPLLQAIGAYGSKSYIEPNIHVPTSSGTYINHQELPETGQRHSQATPLEEPPSLALQLQANNFLHNDIAHPFYESSSHHVRGPTINQFYHPLLGQRSANVRPIDVYPDQQHHLRHALEMLQPDSTAYLQQPHMEETLRNPLVAAGSELNPMFPMMYSSAMQRPSQVVSDQYEPVFAASDNAPSIKTHTSPLKGNKKRSSEFFASAGQILLSALPLLLAPTLGFMFASSPNPVARYQGPNPFVASGSGPFHTSIPGTYINSLNSGIVSNASPSPHLFTPKPGSYGGSSSKTSTSSSTQPSRAPNLATTTLAPSTKSRNTITTSKVLTITTFAPAQVPNSTFQPNVLQSVNFSDQTAAINLTKFPSIDLHSGHTIILVSHEDKDNEEDQHEQPNKTSTLLSQIGHDGVDFDAQYPSLQRKTTSQQPSELENFSLDHISTLKDKNRYKYSQVLPNDSILEKPLKNSSKSSSAYDEASSRLYPVSTWPPMRRRTVSLVTSSGNKTLLDASDGYNSDGLVVPLVFKVRNYTDTADRRSNLGNKMVDDFVSSSSTSEQEDDKSAPNTNDHSTKRKRRKRDLSTELASGKRIRIIKTNSNRQIRKDEMHPNKLWEETQTLAGNKVAHVKAMMIAQPDNNDIPSLDQSLPDNYMDEDEQDQLKEELLAKKMPPQYNSLPEEQDQASPQLYATSSKPPEQVLSAGARGGYPMPIEVTSTSIKFYTNDSNPDGGSGLAIGKKSVVSVGDTKKAHKNFETSFAKDSSVDQFNEFEKGPTGDRAYRNVYEQVHLASNKLNKDLTEGSATERAFTRTPMAEPGEFGADHTVVRKRNGPQAEGMYPTRQQNGPQANKINNNSMFKKAPNTTHLSDNFQPDFSKSSFVKDRMNLIDNESSYGHPSVDDRPSQMRESYHHRQPVNYMQHQPPAFKSGYHIYPSSDHENRSVNDTFEPVDAHFSSYLPSRRQEPPLYNHDHYNYSAPGYYSNHRREHSPPYPERGYMGGYPAPDRPGSHPNYTNYAPMYHKQHYNNHHGYHPHEDYPNSYNKDHYDRYSPQPSGPYTDSRYPSSRDSLEVYPPRSDADHYSSSPYFGRQPSAQQYQPDSSAGYAYSPASSMPAASALMQQGGPLAAITTDKSDSKIVDEYLKRVQFSDSDRDKLMASYLTCDGLLNDSDHCLERLSCEFSDPQNIEKANKLDRAVSSILLGHILINTYIPNQFKLRLKSASLFGYTQSGKCSRFACNKLTRPNSANAARE